VGSRISLCPEEVYEQSRERERERERERTSVYVHCREFVLVETFICFQNLMITMCFVNWCSSCSLYPRYQREVVRRRRKRRCTTAARWVGGRGGDQEGWGGREWGWSIKWRRYRMGRKLQVGKEAQQGQDRSGDTLATLWRVVASFMCLVVMAKMSVRHKISMSLIVVRISPAATTHRHKPYVRPLCVLYSRVLGHCCNEFKNFF